MREVDFGDTVLDLQDDEDDTLCILAPNYESRSVAGVANFIHALESNDKKVRFAVLTFKPSHYRVEALEYLKKVNLEWIESFLLEHNHQPISVRDVRYPESSLDRKLLGIMNEFSLHLTDRFTLALDISAFPRHVIIALLDIIKNYCLQGKIKKLFILYSWAQNYPQLHYPADLGELLMVKTYFPLRARFEKLGRDRAVQAALFIGRQGFDARQFVETLPDDRTINVNVFINRDNVFSSLEVSRANASIITDPSLNVHYFFTIDTGHEKLMRWARECPTLQNTAYLVAPFGPKPLVISAWMAAQKIGIRGREIPGLLSDVVLLSSHQYSTTYSIGFRELTIFQLDLNEMSGKEPSYDLESVQS